MAGRRLPHGRNALAERVSEVAGHVARAEAAAIRVHWRRGLAQPWQTHRPDPSHLGRRIRETSVRCRDGRVSTRIALQTLPRDATGRRWRPRTFAGAQRSQWERCGRDALAPVLIQADHCVPRTVTLTFQGENANDAVSSSAAPCRCAVVARFVSLQRHRLRRDARTQSYARTRQGD